MRDFAPAAQGAGSRNLGPSLNNKRKLMSVCLTIAGSTAGGCRNYISTFASNPQFKVVLTDSDDDADDLCTCLISLLQKGSRKRKAEGDGDGGCLTIGECSNRITLFST